MTHLNANEWQVAAGIALMVLVGAVAFWLVFHRRKTPEEIERARRQFLVHSGRLVDGMSLDVCKVEAKDGRALTMLIYSYRIGGVDYECAQDLTNIRGMEDAAHVRAGFPCTVRYQPGNPQNSIVVAEEWSGMREGLPVLPAFEDPESLHMSALRPGRG